MAGRGTRLRPHTHVTPKPLLPVVGTPMVERIVETFINVLPRKLDEAVFVLGDFPSDVNEQLEAICARHDVIARFAKQDVALGTGHAAYCAKEHLDGEVIVVFADTLFSMSEQADLDNADAVIWTKWVEDPARFGVAVKDEDGRIASFVEKPDTPISHEALIGINYIREGKNLRDALQHIMDENITGHGNEYQLTDALDHLIKQGLNLKTASVDEWLDCGTIDALIDTSDIIRKKQGEARKDGDVVNSVIVEPVCIGSGAVVENSIVGPNVTLEPGSRIVNSVVKDSILFEKACVSDSILERSVIGRYAEVAQYSGKANLGDHPAI